MRTEKRFSFKTVFLFSILLFFGKAFSFELFQFSLAPKYAFQNGRLDELVLYKNGKKLSELNWDIKEQSLLGFNATIGWEMLLIETDCMWGFPKSSGMMLDSDWQNTSDYSMKTNYSESDNSIDSSYNLNVRLGVNIKTWDFLHIIPYAGVSYSRIKFSADGGTFWYGDADSQAVYAYGSDWQSHLSEFSNVSYNSPSAVTGSFDSYGEVITYERETYDYFLGAKANFTFLTRFTAFLDFGFSVFTQINSIDHHILRDGTTAPAYFFDEMSGFLKSFTLASGMDVKIWKGLSCGAGFKYTYIAQLKGTDKGRRDRENQYVLLDADAGASGYFYNVELFVRYSF